MIRICVVLLAMLQLGFSQTTKPVFETKFYEARDRWVLFDKKEDQESYSLGMIYIDPNQGYMFQYEAAVELRGGKLIKLPRLDSSSIKMRSEEHTSELHHVKISYAV